MNIIMSSDSLYSQILRSIVISIPVSQGEIRFQFSLGDLESLLDLYLICVHIEQIYR